MNCVQITFVLVLVLPQIILAKRSKVFTLNSENWNDVMEGEWMIKFYAPWCPACRSMAGDYKEFADWSDDLNIRVAEVNINEETGLSGRFIVTALPTIYHAKDGEFRRYSGPRDTNTLHKYIEDKLWRGTEPVGWYRRPDSVPMTLMSYLFQTSMIIKTFHEKLTEEYGFSATVSYVIFGIATIITGLLLGLALVFIIECIAPQKKVQRQGQTVTPREKVSDKEEDSDEDNHASAQDSQSGSGSEEEPAVSQMASQSSSQISQDWEKVTSEEEEGDVSKKASDKEDHDKEDQGELRRRKTNKDDEEA